MKLAAQEGWVGIAEVAAHLQVTTVSIYRWVAAKGFPARRVGRLLRFRLSEVDEWVKAGGDESGTSASDKKADTRPSTMAETEQGGPPTLLTRQSAKKNPDRTAHCRARHALDRSDIQGVMRSKDPRLTIIGVFLAAATLMLGFPAPAHAQTVLVSNTGQSNAGQTSVNPSDHAQGFTTGQNTLGYSLTSIELGVGVASGSGTLTVTVRGDDGSGDPGGNTLYTLNNPANVAAGLRTFTAPAGASLSANTQYFVQMVFAPNGSASYPQWDNTTSSLQDSGSAIGWSIRNGRHVRTPGSTGWGSINFTVLQIRVNGQIRAPAAPMNLSATPDDGQVTLSWTNPANNTITKYQYRRKTDTGTYGSWTDIPNSGDTTTSYTVTGLTNGTQYTFGVRAVNAGGNGAASTVTATPAPVPAAPTNLEAEVRDRRIGLTWDDPGDSTIDEYEYSTDGGSFSVISGSDDTTTSYTVTGLTNGTQYTFAVRAVNNTDDGVESTVTATPLWPAPTGLVATAGQGRVTLEWNNGHAGIGDYFTYARGSDIVDRTKFLPRRSGSTTTDIVYPLTNGILYTFSVRALHGKESPTVTARPVSMPAPDNLSATEGDDRQTTLSWSDPGDDSIYKYQVSIDNGTTFTDISGSSKSTTATIVAGLTNGTGYTLAVRGVNWWGYGAASTATATPLWPAPANLVATPDDGRIYLEWDTNPGITDYRVDVSDGSSVNAPAGSGSKTIAAIASLINGTEYTFTVLATQGTADSSWPAAVNATPMAVLPDAPTNLSATPSNGKVTLSWDDPGNNTITKYQVSRDGGTSFTDISNSGATTTTTTVTGLTNGTQYTFAVRAVNTTGDGAAATTTATPVNDAPTASAKTVSMDEDTAYIFKEDDFGFASVKSGATLGHVKITALPGPNQGTLSVGGTAIASVTTPRQVTKTGLDAGNLTYTPPANANGAAFATFAFKVNDGVADSDMAYTITINVNAVNDPITGSDKTVSTDEDTAYIFKEADFAFSDVDAGATLNHVKITALPGPNQGTLSVGGTAIASVSPPRQVTKAELNGGDLTYTPPTNANGAAFATFDFKVSDGTDDSDDEYTLTIDVNAVNDPPVAITDTAETSENIPVVIGVLENDSDVDPGTALRVVEVGFPTAPNNGTAAINTNATTVTYTPNANVTGTDTFSYAVTDGIATANVPVTVTILQSGANANLSNLTISSGTLTPNFAATTTSYAVTVETPTGSVQVTPTTADAQATVTVNGALVDSGTASSEIPLSAVDEPTHIPVEVTAQNNTTKTYTITVTQRLSNNANLSGLTISSGTLTPVFAVGTTDYGVDVGNAVTSVTVTPTTEHADATVTVNGALVPRGTASSEIPLSAVDEPTHITVEVTAANGMATKAYAIEVRRAEDETRPRVEIQTEASAPVGGAFEVTIRFSESVLGFTLTDIGVSNGTASNFNRVSSRAYTVTITPEATGEVRVEVGSNVAEDAAGNGNRAAEPLVIEADLTGPEVEITSEAMGAVNGAFEVTITFSEAVTGFEQSEITVTNGTVSSFSGSGTSYTVEITPSESGKVTVEVGADVAEDAAGNGNQAAGPFIIEADLEQPEVTIEGPTEPVGMAGFEVTIAFSEPVEGFEPEDIQVSNGMVADFTEVSSSEYRATIKPAEAGQPVVVEVPEEVAEDGAGNGNQAAEAFEVETKLAVSYQEESYTAREGGETVTVTVKLSQGWDEELVIPIRVTRPETTEVADYTLDGLQEWDAQEGTGTLTFQAEETEQILRIAANHDGDGDDETVELGFGELPEIVMAGEPAVATVTLEDKGLVELKVSFGQTEYQIREGQQADIEVTVSPAADRRVEVPLVVAPKGGATDEDYSGVPSKVVFEEGESQGTISVAVLADEVNDPGEGIVLSLGELPEAVRAGEIPETTVNFTQQRTAEQFSQTLEVMLAVMARTMGESAQTAIEGRFERHRQWSRLGAAGGAVPTAQPGSDNSATGLGEGESQRIGSESLEGAGRRRAEGPVVPSAGGAAGARAAMGSSGESGDRESGVQGAWLQNVSLGGLAGLFGYGQGDAGVSTGSGRGPSGTGPTVGLGGQPGYGQNRFQGSGTRNSSLRSGSGEYSGRRNQELNLAGVSLELPLAGQQKGTSRSWVPALWGQGDLTRFNGNLTQLGMSYRGGLEAAHVGLDLYANDKVLAGLSFMRSWGNMDYSDDGIDGVLGSRMNTFHPYLYWQPTERVSVWGMGGLGRGQVDVNEPGRSHDFEADFRMFSGGVRTVLSRRGSNEVGLRADAFTAQLETDASGDIGEVRGEAHRARLMLEWVHTKQLSAGRSLSLKAEAGGRFDGGDADRGSGAETGFRLGYLDANSGLDVAMLGRVLVVHESDYRDWGLGVQASWDPGEKQRGFRVSVTSTRGQDGGGRTTLWNNANTVTRPPGMGAMGMSSQSRMESEVAYGGLKTLGLPGLLTPYSRLRWAGQGRELAWGTAWSLPPRSQLALPLMLELEAMRRENSMGPADLAVLVRMSIPF